MTTVVERMFHVETAAERAAWLEAIQVPPTHSMVKKGGNIRGKKSQSLVRG